MRRLVLKPRSEWQQKLEDIGFHYHSLEGTYWSEEACYAFSPGQVDVLEKATNTLQDLCAQAVHKVIERDWFDRLKISVREAEHIVRSWDRDELSLYGRFDLAWDGRGEPKMLEYNADTPTSLFEAAIVQWQWQSERFPKADQFNSIHERLKKRWTELNLNGDTLYFMCMRDSVEDISQTEYLRDTAHQAGLKTQFLFIDDLGWRAQERWFVDLENVRVAQAFKLYPWEWLIREQFGWNLGEVLRLVEPAWKRVLSTKAILPILWEMFPGHPNLLRASFEPMSGDHVRKPMLSREGARVSVFEGGSLIAQTDGQEECRDFIYQDYHPLPCFDGRYPVIGSWIIGEEAAGMGIREDAGRITTNTSHFVPHYVERTSL